MCSQDAANAISDPLILKNFQGDALGLMKEPLSMSPVVGMSVRMGWEVISMQAGI